MNQDTGISQPRNKIYEWKTRTLNGQVLNSLIFMRTVKVRLGN